MATTILLVPVLPSPCTKRSKIQVYCKAKLSLGEGRRQHAI